MINSENVKEVALGQPHDYKKLCVLFEEERKTGKSKQCQLARWACYFSWERPSPRTFIPTEIFPTPKELPQRGGAREGAGKKYPCEEEFEWLLNAYLSREYSRNLYGDPQAVLSECHFTNTEIKEYFGFHSDAYYNAGDDSIVPPKLLEAIGDKLGQLFTSWIINQFAKTAKNNSGCYFGEGLIAKDKDNKYSYPDELLDTWKYYKKEYCEKNDIKQYELGKKGKWFDMLEYVSSQEEFEDYKVVMKGHVFSYAVKEFPLYEYELSELGTYRKRFNEKVVSAVRDYISSKEEYPMDMVDYALSRYVMI